MSEYIPLKEYAIKNKISIFMAMKLAKSGKVESVTKIVDGKDQIFIKSDAMVKEGKASKKEPTIKDLMQEIQKLKIRVSELENKLK